MQGRREGNEIALLPKFLKGELELDEPILTGEPHAISAKDYLKHLHKKFNTKFLFAKYNINKFEQKLNITSKTQLREILKVFCGHGWLRTLDAKEFSFDSAGLELIATGTTGQESQPKERRPTVEKDAAGKKKLEQQKEKEKEKEKKDTEEHGGEEEIMLRDARKMPKIKKEPVPKGAKTVEMIELDTTESERSLSDMEDYDDAEVVFHCEFTDGSISKEHPKRERIESDSESERSEKNKKSKSELSDSNDSVEVKSAESESEESGSDSSDSEESDSEESDSEESDSEESDSEESDTEERDRNRVNIKSGTAGAQPIKRPCESIPGSQEKQSVATNKKGRKSDVPNSPTDFDDAFDQGFDLHDYAAWQQHDSSRGPASPYYTPYKRRRYWGPQKTYYKDNKTQQEYMDKPNFAPVTPSTTFPIHMASVSPHDPLSQTQTNETTPQQTTPQQTKPQQTKPQQTTPQQTKPQQNSKMTINSDNANNRQLVLSAFASSPSNNPNETLSLLAKNKVISTPNFFSLGRRMYNGHEFSVSECKVQHGDFLVVGEGFGDGYAAADKTAAHSVVQQLKEVYGL